jgi:hypothetical protein
MEIMRLFIYIPRRFKSITYVILYIMCTIIISLNNNIINLRKKKGGKKGEKVVRQNYFSLSVCLFVGCLTLSLLIFLEGGGAYINYSSALIPCVFFFHSILYNIIIIMIIIIINRCI